MSLQRRWAGARWHLRHWLSRQFGRCVGFTDTWRGGVLRPWVLRAPVLGWRKIRRDLVARFTQCFGRAPQLSPPVTLNEIVIHRIIHDRDPGLRLTCDKIAVRRLIADTVGAQYAVPLIGAWKRAGDIPWDRLPLPVVIKPSQSSGPFHIVERLDEEKKAQLMLEAEQWLQSDYFDKKQEWAYLGLPRRVIAEPLLASPDGGSLIEIEPFVFAGRCAIVACFTGRKSSPERCAEWYDRSGQRLDLIGHAPYIDRKLTPDACERFRRLVRTALPVAVDLAERAARGFALMRVDFYVTDGGLRIGELTPYPAAGTGAYKPRGWDERLGRQFFTHLAEARRQGLRFARHWPPPDWGP